MKNNLIVITGPTAVGKTDAGIQIARHFSAEIISADSRQFYREMNIGTAKPSFPQLKEIKHHFINSLSVPQDYNAGQFESDCLRLLEELFKKNNTVIMVGGAGLYINAVLNGVDQLPPADSEKRQLLKEKFEQKGIVTLQEQLKELDPEYYAKADIQNPQRLMRAIEVCLVSGKKYSSLLGKKKAERNFNAVLIGLNLDKIILYERINARVDKMIDDGLVDEVKNILPYKEYNALQTVGYKELILYFEEKISLEEAVELIKKNTRNYAKRQMTWFRNMKDIVWFEAGEMEKILDTLHLEFKIS
ncbi:MAG: tRNA (adenosine(37)-N6)-dimethylallyltransferase MiaA [Bacteroidia bacterium]